MDTCTVELTVTAHLLYLTTSTYWLPPTYFIYLILTNCNSGHKQHGKYETYFNCKKVTILANAILNLSFQVLLTFNLTMTL